MKPKIEAYIVEDNLGSAVLFRHSKECQCKLCIIKWVNGDPYYGDEPDVEVTQLKMNQGPRKGEPKICKRCGNPRHFGRCKPK